MGLYTQPISFLNDRDGKPLARASLQFYVNRTRTPLVTYKDAARIRKNPETIASDEAGRWPPIWLPFQAGTTLKYTVECLDDQGGMVFTSDDQELPIQGAESGATLYAFPLVSTSQGGTATTITLAAANFKGLLSVAASAANVYIDIPNTGLAAGRNLTIRQIGFGSAVVIRAGVNILIDQTRAYPLRDKGESATIVWDGGGFVVADHNRLLGGIIPVTSRIDAAPASPLPGAVYLAKASTASFVKDYLYKADGAGGFIEYAPATGWIAVVGDEDVAAYAWTGTTWKSWIGSGGAADAVLHVQLQRATNTAGGIPVYGAWTRTDLNTVVKNEITGASLSGNQIILPSGSYDLVDASRSMGSTMGSGLRFHSPSSGKSIRGVNEYLQGNVTTVSATQIAVHVGGAPRATGVIDLTATDTFELQYFAQPPVGGSNNADLGFPLNTASLPEIYANVLIRKRNRS